MKGVTGSSLVFMALFGVACEGAFNEDSPDTGPTACEAVELTEKPLRRLSNAELKNTLRQVLGAELVAGLVMPARTTAEDGFDADHQALQVSELVVEQLHDLALAVSLSIVQDPLLVLGCDLRQDEPKLCLEQLIDDLVPRAFRRPLSGLRRQRFVDLADDLLAEEELSVATALLVQAILQAPEFLYRLQQSSGEGQMPGSERLDDYTIAHRLSYLVWQAPPDEALLSDAAEGNLGDAETRVAHVRRMLADARAEAPLRDFARQWLGLARLAEADKDAERFPEYSAALADEMREQTERFVAQTLAVAQSPLDSLLTDRELPMTSELATIYGVEHSGQSTWVTVSLPAAERAGLLTQASLLTLGGHQVEGSPILRGVDILERILCIEPTPPPQDIDTAVATAGEDDALRTNRERFEAHIASPQCASCHDSFNPIGYALENYDAVGRFRTHDNGIPVDARADLTLGGELGGLIDGPVALSKKFAQSDAFAGCIQRKIARFASARQLVEADQCRMDQDVEAMKGNGHTYLAVLERQVGREDFITRPTAVTKESH